MRNAPLLPLRRRSGFFNVPVAAEGVKNILESVSYFSVNKSERGGASALLCSWGSFNWMDYLLSFDVSWPHLTGAERRSAFCTTSFSRRRPKNLHLREPWSLRAAPGLLQHCVLCIIVLISTDNIPADPRFQSCRLKGQNFSPSSPRRLIPGFTSSALRKFNCNLGLDRILLLQKVGATW